MATPPNLPPIEKLVVSRYEYSRNTFTPLLLRSARWYDMFRGWTTGQFQSYRNNVSIPLLLSTVLTDVSRKINISFGVWPYVSMVGGGPEDVAIARKNEQLVSQQLRDVGILSRMSDAFLSADLYGTAIVQHGWLQKKENILYRQAAVGPMSGKRLDRAATKLVTQFDGPMIENIDILDFFPQPGFVDIEDMGWVIRRYYLDLDELEMLSKPKSEGGPGVYDREAVRRLRDGMRGDVDRDFVNRRTLTRNPAAELDTKRMDKYARPVELLEMWGTVPNEFVPEGARTQRVITVANRGVCIRNSPNPFWHGRKPFLALKPVRDPHYFHGIGKCEIGEKIQLMVNRMNNQKLDALDLYIDPVMVYNRDQNIDTRRLYMRSGFAIGVDGDVNTALKTLSPDLSTMQNAYQEIEAAWRWMQLGTGITEGTIGTASASSRSTAREFLARQENVSVRLLLESRLAEEMLIEPTCDAFRALNKQFLPVPRQLKMIGEFATTNPVTGMPIPPEEAMSVDLDDLNMDYNVRARGATQTVGKAVRQQNLITLLTALSTSPMAAMVNWQAFARDMFYTFEFTNVDELLTPNPMQAALLGAMGGAPGMAPPGAIGGMESMLPLPGAEQESTLSGLEGQGQF